MEVNIPKGMRQRFYELIEIDFREFEKPYTKMVLYNSKSVD